MDGLSSTAGAVRWAGTVTSRVGAARVTGMARIGAGAGCRRAYQARPAMEGVGIDVVKTSQNAGLPFDIPPKNEVVWSGLVLIE